MDRPDDDKGTVMIRTRFGEVAAAHWFPALTLDALITDQTWREAAGAQDGPFCYTPQERLMPF